MTEIGSLRLEVLRTELRLLATNWFYEQVTHTLFSCDSFGFVAADTAGSRLGTQMDFDPAEIARFLGAKMDWLIGIDRAPIIADLERLQASRPIARICPGFECVIEGREAVARAFDPNKQALRLLGARSRVPALATSCSASPADMAARSDVVIFQRTPVPSEAPCQANLDFINTAGFDPMPSLRSRPCSPRRSPRPR